MWPDYFLQDEVLLNVYIPQKFLHFLAENGGPNKAPSCGAEALDLDWVRQPGKRPLRHEPGVRLEGAQQGLEGRRPQDLSLRISSPITSKGIRHRK